jgi:hypothetical protein
MEDDPSLLTAITPLYAVLEHLITMPMLSDLTGIPISRPLLHATERGVLSTISPEVIELRMKSDTVQSSNNKEEVAFVRLQMEGFNPYFDSALERIMDGENPYNPIWKAFEEISPQYFSLKHRNRPTLEEHHRRHETENPVNGLHVFLGRT